MASTICRASGRKPNGPSPGLVVQASTWSRVCAFVGPRFGIDFDSVRIHRGAAADVAARAANARAFTRAIQVNRRSSRTRIKADSCSFTSWRTLFSRETPRPARYLPFNVSPKSQRVFGFGGSRGIVAKASVRAGASRPAAARMASANSRRPHHRAPRPSLIGQAAEYRAPPAGPCSLSPVGKLYSNVDFALLTMGGPPTITCLRSTSNSGLRISSSGLGVVYRILAGHATIAYDVTIRAEPTPHLSDVGRRSDDSIEHRSSPQRSTRCRAPGSRRRAGGR